MGAEAKTTLKVGRQTFAGTAHLETSEVRFRGETLVKGKVPAGTPLVLWRVTKPSVEKLIIPRAAR